MKDHSGNVMLAHDGTPLEAEQVWMSRDEKYESLLVGVSSQGFPVFEKGKGWASPGEYLDTEKFWKSVFIHHLKPNAPADLPAVAGKVRRDVGQEVKP